MPLVLTTVNVSAEAAIVWKRDAATTRGTNLIGRGFNPVFRGLTRFLGRPRTESSREKCSREESNLHGFPHTVLSRTRLPFRHVSKFRHFWRARRFAEGRCKSNGIFPSANPRFQPTRIGMST